MEAPINKLVFQMSEQVYEALCVCADNEYYTFAILEPKDDEEPEQRKKLIRDLTEIEDLTQIGLLKDVSTKYRDDINKCKKEHGFYYKVMELTQEGVLMFAHAKDRKIN